jgi:hypothetical protein
MMTKYRSFEVMLSEYDDTYLDYLYLRHISGVFVMKPETEMLLYWEMISR